MILIINITCNELLTKEFVKPIEQIVKENYEVKHYTKLKDLDKFSHVIICGTALKDNKYLESIELFKPIFESKAKILGICGGAQIIAKYFGAKITNFQEVGMKNIEILKEDKILKNFSQKDVYLMHNFAFELPETFEKIAETQIPVLIKKENIYACLFHPEVKCEKIIENFLTT
ncbi:MAG: glutamine amidotransferase-related protein [Nanoarchaeota archaeon]